VNALFALGTALLLERLLKQLGSGGGAASDMATEPKKAKSKEAKGKGKGKAPSGAARPPPPPPPPCSLRDAPASPTLRALCLACFPPHFFFAFLFYTDVLSTFFVLLTLLLLAAPPARRAHATATGRGATATAPPRRSDALADKPVWAGALAGAASIVCRQTNVVWLVFAAGAAVVADLQQAHGDLLERADEEGEVPRRRGRQGKQQQQQQQHGGKEDGEEGEGGGTKPRDAAEAHRLKAVLLAEARQAARRAAAEEARVASVVATGESTEPWLPGALLLRRFALLLWKDRRRLLARLAPVLAVVGAFGAFVARNGGIVVGDRANHAPVLHFAQLGYFVAFAAPYLAAVGGAPLALLRRLGRAFLRQCAQPAGAGVLLWGVVLAALCLCFGSPAHPFLLADNRHFPFYVWKAFFRRHAAAKYAPLPAYFCAAWALAAALRRPRPGSGGGKPVSALWLAGFAAATALVLVPAHLVEPRYFLVPFFVAHTHAEAPSTRAALLTLGVVAAANAATIYVFLYRPFTWPDGSTARFMW
jgi:alpha-1,2-glucosyltransferase